MRFIVPAPYARYVEQMIHNTLKIVQLDQDFRSGTDGDPRVNAFAYVSDAMIDADAKGETRIEINVAA